MANSSINIKKNSSSLTHNDRSGREPKYLLPSKFRKENEFDRTADEAQKLLDEYISEAKANYTKITGQKFQAKVLKFEAVVNLNENHTMEDMKKLNLAIEKEFGFRAVQTAIHRDEGHIDTETNEPIYNYHCHIVFCNLDKNGKTLLKQLNRSGLRELQTLTAEVLQMQRGESAEITKAKHKSHQQFKKEKIEEELVYQKNKNQKQALDLILLEALQESNKQLRDELKQVGATRQEYAELEALNKELKSKIKEQNLTIDELNQKIEDYKKNKNISQSNGNGSKTNENDLNDKSIDQEQKIVLNGLEDDFKLETEIEKKGLLTKSYEIKLIEEFKNPPKIEDLRLFSRIKRKFLDIYQTVKAQAKKIFELESENKELKNQVSFLKAENLKLKRDLKQQVKELSIEALEQSSPKQQKKEIEITEQFNPMQKIRDELKDLEIELNKPKPFKPKAKIQGQNRSNGVDLSR